MPVNILIRDVPDEVRDALAAAARIQGKSMQAYLHDVLSSHSTHARNMALIDEVRAMQADQALDGPQVDVVELIRQQREARTAELVGRVLDEPAPDGPERAPR